MAILKSCCFWRSVRKGTYASVIYTMVFFGISFLIIAQYIYEEREFIKGERDKPLGESILEQGDISPVTVIFNLVMLICSGFGFLSSILVIVALRMNQRFLLIPWIVFMILNGCTELTHFFYLLLRGILEFNPLNGFIFTMDFFIMCLNTYCLLCVISQYQELKEGRGIGCQDYRTQSVLYQSQSTKGGSNAQMLVNSNTSSTQSQNNASEQTQT
ncbi:hypothetical protein ACFFRR_010646 [Megaselia abdita]